MTVRVRDTRTAIRDVAIRMIAAKGFDHTSLREVAAEVGITKASLYYHYSSKVDLLAAIVEPVIDEMQEIAADLDDAARSRDDVEALLRRYTTTLVEHRAEGVLFVRDAVAIINAIGDRFPEIVRVSERLREWLAGPNADSAARLRAAAALDVLGVALTATDVAPEASDAEVVHILLGAAMAVLDPYPSAADV